jgi:hypothetical protein
MHMMIDGLLIFDPAATLITVTAPSTNVLDLGVGRDLAPGGPVLDVFGMVNTTMTAAGAATLQASIQGAPDNGGVPGTWVDLMMTGLLPVANLVAGVEFLRTPLPYLNPAMAGNTKLMRFLRLNYTVATGPFTAGAVYTALIPHGGRQNNIPYGSGFNPFN